MPVHGPVPEELASQNSRAWRKCWVGADSAVDAGKIYRGIVFKLCQYFFGMPQPFLNLHALRFAGVMSFFQKVFKGSDMLVHRFQTNIHLGL